MEHTALALARTASHISGDLRNHQYEVLYISVYECPKYVYVRQRLCWATQRNASWLRRVESYLKDAGMAGLASAWAMARRRPREYRRKVDAGCARYEMRGVPDAS